MLTVEEMAYLLNPHAGRDKLSLETARLQRRVYEPLQAAFNMRDARQQYIGLEDAASGESLAIRGQRFPVSHIGSFNYKGQERFCIDKDAAILCRYALFGRSEDRKPEWLSEDQAQRLLDIPMDQLRPVLDRIKDAFLDRRPYERSITIELPDRSPVKISLDHIGFFKQDGQVSFFLLPDALKPLHQLLQNSTVTETGKWWKDHPLLQRVKSAEWLNQEDVVNKLALGTLGEIRNNFNAIWKEIESVFKRGGKPQEGADKNITIRRDRDHTIRCAEKRTLKDTQQHLCINQRELEWLKYQLGMESTYSPEQDRRKGRGGRGGNEN
jgi:hypothetical protein